MRNNKTIFWFLVAFLACAKQGIPPGGPVDETPPIIIRTFPDPGSTMVDPQISVRFWFNEGIQPSSASEAIFITPYPGENVSYKWRGKRLSIKFSKPLQQDKTYVITLGTGLRDYRNNGMQSSYTLAFSTGALIDEGEITGKVYDLKDSRGVDVWAYTVIDSLETNPFVQEPDYIVQCGKGGEFKFSHLSPGLYRLFVVKDLVSDRLYQSGEDEIGISWKDILLSGESKTPPEQLFFRMTKEDTVGPGLVRAFAVDKNNVALSFDEPVVIQAQKKNLISIVLEEEPADTLQLKLVYNNPVDPNSVKVMTGQQLEGKSYYITVNNFEDYSGHMVSPDYNHTLFNGSGEQDTTRPSLIQTYPLVNEKSADLDGMVRFIFSEAMDSSHFSDGFLLTDSSQIVVSGEMSWKSPAEFIFQSHEKLKSESNYCLSLSGKGVMDFSGNSLIDTVYYFSTMNVDTLSEIIGTILDPDSQAKGSVFIAARQIGSNLSYQQILQEPGRYRLKNVLPGLYLVEAFRDRDGNGKYSYGKPFPYRISERFAVYGDTIDVRSKWPNEGNDFRFFK